MLLTLLALLVVAVVLSLPAILRAARRWRERAGERRSTRSRREALHLPDPGRERRAEQRARELLRSCVGDEEWAMYRDLGFIRVYGRQSGTDPDGGRPVGAARDPIGPGSSGSRSYAYLIYPHKPIVAYLPETGRLLSEYCVEFSELAGAITGSRLPDSDDVLAKWMALTADERRLLSDANMHLPGRQVDPVRVRRDIWRLGEWERQRRRDDRVASR